MVKYCTGNIFNSECEYIVIPVNCVGAMGKGLAKEFSQREPHLIIAYRLACNDRVLNISNPILLENYVLFPTKIHWKDSSNIEWIKSNLIKLYQHHNYIQSIAIPKLGCGEGGLQWENVKPFIEIYGKAIKYCEIYE